VQVTCEHQDQHDAPEEFGDRDAEEGDHRNAVVDRGVVLDRRNDAEADADDRHQQQRYGRQHR
jgi:hypothetical protein